MPSNYAGEALVLLGIGLNGGRGAHRSFGVIGIAAASLRS